MFRADLVTIPAVQVSFEERGLDAPPVAAIYELIGKPGGDLRAWLGSWCPKRYLDEVEADIRRREDDLVVEAGELYPGVREMLSDLRGSVDNMAICSNGGRDYVTTVLSTQRIEGLFDLVRYRRPGDASKPLMAGEIVQRLGTGLGAVIGDRRDDIEAAHRNGLQAIAATYGFGPPHELARADAFAASPADIPGQVAALVGDSVAAGG